MQPDDQESNAESRSGWGIVIDCCIIVAILFVLISLYNFHWGRYRSAREGKESGKVTVQPTETESERQD